MNPRRGNDSCRIDLRLLSSNVATQKSFLTNWNSEEFKQIVEIKSAAKQLPVSSKQMTDILWSSIDNNDSKDLDQIEYAESLPNGDVRVVVGIADVDLYVPKGSPIDLHAAANTTSLYPGPVIYPMLPDDLYSDLSSLRQDVDRAAIVVDLIVALNGTIESSDIYRATVRNKAKLAYAAVGRWFDGEAERPSKDVNRPGLEVQLKLQEQESQRFHDAAFAPVR